MTTDNPKNGGPEVTLTGPDDEPKAAPLAGATPAAEPVPVVEAEPAAEADGEGQEVTAESEVAQGEAVLGAATVPDATVRGPTAHTAFDPVQDLPSLPPLYGEPESDPVQQFEHFAKQQAQSLFHITNLERSVERGLGKMVVASEKVSDAADEVKQVSSDLSAHMSETYGIHRREGWKQMQVNVSGRAPIVMTVLLSGDPEVIPEAVNLVVPALAMVESQLDAKTEGSPEVTRG